MDFVWLWKGSSKEYVESEHVHNFDEFIGFLGTKGPQDPDSWAEKSSSGWVVKNTC